jgi:hypothetical protein
MKTNANTKSTNPTLLNLLGAGNLCIYQFFQYCLLVSFLFHKVYRLQFVFHKEQQTRLKDKYTLLFEIKKYFFSLSLEKNNL